MTDADPLTKHDAEYLAARLRSFWAERGHTVVVTVEETLMGRRKKPVWSVRSNLAEVLSREQKGRPHC
jgi:hypothetical protein